MEGQGRKLGLIAIGLGLLVLGFMLGSRGAAAPRWHAYGPPAGYEQQAPPAPRAPGYEQPRYEQPRYEQQAPRGEFGSWHGRGYGHPPFFLAPLFFIGGLAKLALLGLLLFALLRHFGRGRGPGDKGKGDSDRPGPEQPTSYTDGTVRL